jgi:hypothetical protein
MKPAIGVGLALLAYQFFKGLNQEVRRGRDTTREREEDLVCLSSSLNQYTRPAPLQIPRLDPSNELMLRQVFFGESIDDGSSSKHNYVVLCQKEDTEHISSVFVDAYAQKTGLADFLLVDCDATLESGKTIAERFKLNTKQRPTMFVSGHVGQPKQVRQRPYVGVLP